MTAKEMTITRIDQAIRQLRFVRDQADMSLDSLTAVRESISANDATGGSALDLALSAIKELADDAYETKNRSFKACLDSAVI